MTKFFRPCELLRELAAKRRKRPRNMDRSCEHRDTEAQRKNGLRCVLKFAGLSEFAGESSGQFLHPPRKGAFDGVRLGLNPREACEANCAAVDPLANLSAWKR